MSVLDRAAELNAAVGRREITKEQAVAALVEFTEGSLTWAGAAIVLEELPAISAARTSRGLNRFPAKET